MQDVLIEINEYNAAPIVESLELWLFENTPKGTKVGPKVVATDDEVDLGLQTLWYSITGGNKDKNFIIDGLTGQIVLDTDDLDYEVLASRNSGMGMLGGMMGGGMGGMMGMMGGGEKKGGKGGGMQKGGMGGSKCDDIQQPKEENGEAYFTLTVTVEDDDPKNPQSTDAEVRINIIDVNEKPDSYKKWEYQIDENLASGAQVGDRSVLLDD